MLTFSNITSFLKRNKKILYYTGFFVILFMVGSGDVFASLSNGVGTPGGPHTTASIATSSSQVSSSATTPKPGSIISPQTGKNIIGWVNVIFIIASMFIGILTQLVSLFLNPGWINGNIIGLDSYMKDIWILISNVVYFIFALLLIVIAFMNIIGKADKWELKQALPKFIIGVLMVPFSWFMVQFILSISAILTVSAISLPFDTFRTMKVNGQASKYLTQKIIPEHCTINLGDKFSDKIKAVSSSTSTTTQKQAQKVLREAYKCTGKLSISQIMNDGNSIFSVIGVYTYGILKVDKFDTMTTADASIINTIVSLGVQGIINAIFLIVMLILLVALGLALFSRGVWLWLYAMFSPVFGLMYFFDKKEGGEGALGNFSFMEFIKLALVPVYVGAALSFGLMFIFVVISGLGLNDTGAKGISKDSPVKFADKGATITLGKVSLTINGSILGNGSNKKTGTPKASILDIVQGGAGTLIVGLLGIVVLWMAVMAAIKSSKITGAVVEPIASFGKSIGDLAMKSPQYLPVFGGISAQGMSRIGKMPQNAMEQKVANRISPFQSKINEKFGVSTISAADKAKFNNLLNNGIKTESQLRALQEILQKQAGEQGTNNSEFRKMFDSYNSALKVSNQFNSLHVEEGKTFDGGNKFTDDSVRALFNSNRDRTKGTEQISQGYASKVLIKGGGMIKAKGEAVAGGIKDEYIDTLKTKKRIEIKVKGDNGKMIGKEYTIKTAGNVKYSISAITDDKDKKAHLIMTVDNKGYSMNFESSSSASFEKVNKVSDFNSKLKGSDGEQLAKLLKEMNGDDRLDFITQLFPNTKGKITMDDLDKYVKSFKLSI